VPGVALGIDFRPERLDLPSDGIKAAPDTGVEVFNADSCRRLSGFQRCGAGTAPRGWLTIDDIINARIPDPGGWRVCAFPSK
jgi:hypothetical protein